MLIRVVPYDPFWEAAYDNEAVKHHFTQIKYILKTSNSFNHHLDAEWNP